MSAAAHSADVLWQRDLLRLIEEERERVLLAVNRGFSALSRRITERVAVAQV